jgi:hypothetical protein
LEQRFAAQFGFNGVARRPVVLVGEHFEPGPVDRFAVLFFFR